MAQCPLQSDSTSSAGNASASWHARSQLRIAAAILARSTTHRRAYATNTRHDITGSLEMFGDQRCILVGRSGVT